MNHVMTTMKMIESMVITMTTLPLCCAGSTLAGGE